MFYRYSRLLWDYRVFFNSGIHLDGNRFFYILTKFPDIGGVIIISFIILSSFVN